MYMNDNAWFCTTRGTRAHKYKNRVYFERSGIECGRFYARHFRPIKLEIFLLGLRLLFGQSLFDALFEQQQDVTYIEEAIRLC